MLKLRYKTSTGLVDYQQAFQTMEKAVANWLTIPTSSSQRKLTSVLKELHSFDFLANAGIQDEEDSSKRTTAPVDLGHLNKVIDPFGEFIVLDPRIREEDAGVEPPHPTSVIRVESYFPDTNERKLGFSNKKDLFEESSLLDPSLRWDDAEGVAEDDDGGVVWFLEHPALYTEGTSADRMELLDGHSLPVYKTNRGGKFTYHGPGQRVVYLVLDLKKLFAPELPDAKRYVFFLEQVIIELLKGLGLEGLRIDGNPGIWVRAGAGLAPKKIAFIGIRIKKWISYHGLAFNISPNLEHFKGIIPCGVKEYGITSLKELKKEITAEEFDKLFKENFERLLKQGI